MTSGAIRPTSGAHDRLATSQPAVSRHLRVLREAGLVGVRADRQRRVYRLQAEQLAELDVWLSHYREFWADRIGALEEHLARRRRTTEADRNRRETP